MDSTDVSIPAASSGSLPGAGGPRQPASGGSAPIPPTPPTVHQVPAAPIQSSAVAGSSDNCANCGAPLAVDQRYCLQCGQRRGDPRLPFMDAVVLMDAVQRGQQPPPPPPSSKKKRSGGISPNAALITGIGVLLLALGLGVLIGRSGNNETASAPQTPQVITVEGSGSGGGEEAATTGGAGSSNTGSGKAPKSKGEKAAKAKEAETQAGAEEVLKPAAGVKLPPAKVQPGGKCPPGSAGCKGEEFTGEFFGE